MKEDLYRLWRAMSVAQRRRFTVLVGLMSVAAVMEMVGIGALLPILALMQRPELMENNSIISEIVDRLGRPSRDSFFITILLSLFLFFLIKNVFLVIIDVFQSKLLAREAADISTRLLKSYMKRPYPFHLQVNTSKLIGAVTTDTNTLLYYILIPGVVLTAEILVVVALLILIILIDPTAAIFGIIAGGGLVLIFLRALRDRVYRIGQEVQQNVTKMLQYAQEGLAGIKEITVMHRQMFFADAFSVHARRHAAAVSRSLIITKLPGHLLETGFVSLFVGGLIVLTAVGKLSTAFALMAVYAAAAFRLIPSLNRILTSVNLMKQGSSALKSVVAELGQTGSRQDLAFESGKLSFERCIELENIFFRYQNSDTDSIQGVSLTINRGELVGFTGRSGCGKTTLIDIVLGLLTPGQGNVRVDGSNISDYLHSWQTNIGYIPQHIYLTDDTLKKNIALGLADEAIDVEQIRRVIEMAQLTDLVGGLPNGVETMVGERGVRLSGGQRQRIGIARALYYDPAVIVMDEGTSALDNETETEVIATLEKMRGHKTILLIAHRLSTIQHCDRIFVLEKGTLARSGTFESAVRPYLPSVPAPTANHQ